jgi:ABC-type antimicrobial peptide transport system permease subunit
MNSFEIGIVLFVGGLLFTFLGCFFYWAMYPAPIWMHWEEEKRRDAEIGKITAFLVIPGLIAFVIGVIFIIYSFFC